MNIEIRPIQKADKPSVLEMMRVFYSSAAVYTNGSEEIFSADIEACTENSPYLEGLVFEKENEILGYAMLAKSFSTEFGKACIWVEDLYIKEEYRGCGIGKDFFSFLSNEYHDCIFRLEVEEENESKKKYLLNMQEQTDSTTQCSL